MKRQGSTELPHFIVGALATAGASAASGATVQITFGNNVVSSVTGLTNFVGDLTGDNVADAEGGAFTSRAVAYVYQGQLLLGAGSTGFGPRVRVRVGYDMQYGQWVAGVTDVTGETFASSRALVPFKFSDARINGGAESNGWLDVESQANLGSGGSVQIHRLIFDDASTTAPTGVASTDPAYSEWQVSAVPEASTSLGLLALGAGGILTRRRSKRAA